MPNTNLNLNTARQTGPHPRLELRCGRQSPLKTHTTRRNTHGRSVIQRELFAQLYVQNKAPPYVTVPYYCTYYCIVLQFRCAPPLALVEVHNFLPHVYLLQWLRSTRFDQRHPGLEQIEGGITIVASLGRALQKKEVR